MDMNMKTKRELERLHALLAKVDEEIDVEMGDKELWKKMFDGEVGKIGKFTEANGEIKLDDIEYELGEDIWDMDAFFEEGPGKKLGLEGCIFEVDESGYRGTGCYDGVYGDEDGTWYIDVLMEGIVVNLIEKTV
jgi:hypothetical protein